MDKIKAFFKSKGIGYYLMFAAFACGLAALITYLATGVTEFTPALDGAVTASYVVFLVLCVAALVADLRIVKYLAAAMGLFSVLRFIVFDINYITNLLVSIDPTPVTAGFVLSVLFGVLAFGVSLAAGILTKSGLAPLKKEDEA